MALAAFAVNHALVVRAGQCVGGRDGVPQGFLQQEGGLGEAIAQRAAIDVLHRDERAALSLTDFEDRMVLRCPSYRGSANVAERSQRAQLRGRERRGLPAGETLRQRLMSLELRGEYLRVLRD